MQKRNVNQRIVFIFCMGLMLSWGIFSFIHNWEQSRIAQEFEYRAAGYAAAIQKELDTVEKAVADVRFLIEHDINLEHDNPLNAEDFMPESERLLINDPQLLSVAWAIFEPAVSRQNSLRVLYVKKGNYSDAVNNDIRVGDVYYDDHVAEGVSSHQNRLIQPLVDKDAHARGNELNFVALVSDHSQGENPQAVQLNDQSKVSVRGKLIGALITEWYVDGLIERALEKMPVSDLDLSLLMMRDDDSKQEVYSHLSRSRTADQMDIHTHLQDKIPFSFAGQKWLLCFEAAPKFLKDRPAILAWQSLIFTLLLTLFIAWRMHRSNVNFMLIEAEVKARTSELEASQQALLSSNQRYSTLVEMSYTGILVLQQGKVLYANPYIAERLGYANRADDMIGHDLLEFIYMEDQKLVNERLEDMSLHGANYLHTEERYQSGSGHLMYSETSSTCIDYEGQSAVLMVVQDVTERHLTESKLQHIDRVESLGVLAGGIAHDFNNILAAILAHASLAASHVRNESPMRSSLDAIINASNTAASLCNQMLAYSGKGQFVIQPIDLSQVARDMGTLIDVAIAKNVRINYQLSEAMPAINADIAQIQQVVLNLITNASEAMEAKHNDRNVEKRISIKTGVMPIDDDFLANHIGYEYIERGRYYAFIEIADVGCGMDDETKQKMFDPYFTTKFTGRGLGMSAILGIIKGHRGGMRIDSIVGQGTTIRVVFPVSSQSPANNIVQPAMQVEKKALTGVVLIIDDELMVRTAASMMLEELGFDVMAASDGPEGVELFRLHHDKISAVLLDLTMPNMDGQLCFEALKGIQADVCAILSSGYSEVNITEELSDLGWAGFLQKPYSIDVLEEKMQRVLSA